MILNLRICILGSWAFFLLGQDFGDLYPSSDDSTMDMPQKEIQSRSSIYKQSNICSCFILSLSSLAFWLPSMCVHSIKGLGYSRWYLTREMIVWCHRYDTESRLKPDFNLFGADLCLLKPLISNTILLIGIGLNFSPNVVICTVGLVMCSRCNFVSNTWSIKV